MGWSLSFLEQRMRGSPQKHRVRVVPLRGGSPLALGDEWVISSTGRSNGVTIADEGWTSLGGELAVGSWSSDFGQWSVPLLGPAGPLMRRLRRGQMVVHEVGFPGWTDSRWEAVQIGQVYALEAGPGRLRLTMRDPRAAMGSRPTLDANGWPLFYSLGTTTGGTWTASVTTLAASYTAGDATLTVTAFSGLDRPTGGTGVVVINPASDAPFYLTYTGTASGPNRLTGVSATGQFGSTARSTANGTTISDAAYVEDDPLSIAAKVLTSTGSATNGPYDVLPNSWGFGLPFERLDHHDMDYFRPRIAPSTGVDDWVMLCEEPQTDGLGWLSGLLNPAGIFLAQRQGCITARAVTNWQGNAAAAQASPITFGRLMGEYIDPDSIRWGAWDGGLVDPYYRLKVISASSDSGDTHVEAATSLPTRDTLPVDLAVQLQSNQTAQRNATAGRLKPYTLRTTERFECDVYHPLAAGLCPGDLIPLHVRYFGGRAEWQTGAYDGRPGLVVRVDPDFVYGRPTHVVMAVPVAAGVG